MWVVVVIAVAVVVAAATPLFFSRRKEEFFSLSFNVRKTSYEQLRGLKGVNVVIDESGTGSSFEVAGIETDGGRRTRRRFLPLPPFAIASATSEMRNSEACLITPHGGLELVHRPLDAILSGCVPLIVHDDFEPYFSDVLDWENYSYKIPTRAALESKGGFTPRKEQASPSLVRNEKTI